MTCCSCVMQLLVPFLEVHANTRAFCPASPCSPAQCSANLQICRWLLC